MCTCAHFKLFKFYDSLVYSLGFVYKFSIQIFMKKLQIKQVLYFSHFFIEEKINSFFFKCIYLCILCEWVLCLHVYLDTRRGHEFLS